MAGLLHMVAVRPLVGSPRLIKDGPVTVTEEKRKARLHRAWIVAGVAFVATVGAAGFRATPGVMINPLRQEFGWSLGAISAAGGLALGAAALSAGIRRRPGLRLRVA